MSRALVYDGITKQTRAHSVRNNNAAIFGLLDTDFIFAGVYRARLGLIENLIDDGAARRVGGVDDGREAVPSSFQ